MPPRPGRSLGGVAPRCRWALLLEPDRVSDRGRPRSGNSGLAAGRHRCCVRSGPPTRKATGGSRKATGGSTACKSYRAPLQDIVVTARSHQRGDVQLPRHRALVMAPVAGGSRRPGGLLGPFRTWATCEPRTTTGSVWKFVWVDHRSDRSSARNHWHSGRCLEAYRSAIPLHVWSVLHAEREVNTQIRVLLGEILHTFIFRLGARTRAHVNRPAKEVT
jgi:hypothetical protein